MGGFKGGSGDEGIRELGIPGESSGDLSGEWRLTWLTRIKFELRSRQRLGMTYNMFTCVCPTCGRGACKVCI